MTKETLTQYGDLVREYGEVKDKLYSIRRKRDRIKWKLARIEREGVVKDKVYGGEGGTQGFVIEGYAAGDYSYQKTSLLQQELALKKNEVILSELEERIARERTELEEFIAHIDDSHIRRIMNFRLIKGMKWADIAIRMGGGNSESGVFMAYKRFVDKYFDES